MRDDVTGASGGRERKSDLGCILKAEPIESTERWDEGCEREKNQGWLRFLGLSH